jgi:Zn-dependent M28 family amino/carboxypeptidase
MLPHTGAMSYAPDAPKIPAAALALGPADELHGLLVGGKRVKVKIELESSEGPEMESANVVGEIEGKSNDIVLISAHLDSWDVGTGALDDGAGVAIVLETARLLSAWAPLPRTVRVVLFMNEERGLSGAKAYFEKHKTEVAKHVVAIETDSGAGKPVGFSITGGPDAQKALAALTAPFARLGVSRVQSAPATGADLIPLQANGVPCVALDLEVQDYFDWHHTEGDTVDKVDPANLAMNVALFSSLVYQLASSSVRFPAPPAPPKW